MPRPNTTRRDQLRDRLAEKIASWDKVALPLEERAKLLAGSVLNFLDRQADVRQCWCERESQKFEQWSCPVHGPVVTKSKP